MAATAIQMTHDMHDCWRGFQPGLWQKEINVRDFIQQNYTPYHDDESFLAGATERVKFGMNAMVASLRDPLVAAKQCATIDFLSGGRLLPVFVPGHDDAPEWRATGRDARERGRLADEILEIMRRLWSEESVTFEGRHFRYADVSIALRPVQQPLPLWIGGHSSCASGLNGTPNNDCAAIGTRNNRPSRIRSP